MALPLIAPAWAIGDAAGIPGATYTGLATDHANVMFTVSSDGTLVDNYSIVGATGPEPGGNHCDIDGGGTAGVWPGAPIDGDAFSYTLGSGILFQGTFTGPQTASGTFRFFDPANGSDPQCDTGVVDWTASTTATPPGGVTSGGGGGGGTGGGTPYGKPVVKPKIPTYATFVTLKKRSAKRLGGSVRTSSKSCVDNRTVYLMAGRKRVAKARTNAHGSYVLQVTAKLRKQEVRATVPARRGSHEICAAGSSKFVTVTVTT